MTNDVLLYIGGILPVFWGIAHLIPTRGIVRDFGAITEDNKLIITMEWVYEGLTLIFIGGLIILVTFLGDSQNNISQLVYFAIIVMLIVMAVWSLLTGFKVNFIPFKLCPVIFIGSACFLALGLLM